ncbi:VQ motif-containing protein 17-like [Ananas comosus]|uniref:VQ motif-containing protein 17-like n=1 Tax=Ananas comosus TaxID=4615 RepID=A0A6P5GCI8_ANACO|nr:VQ motif-containing protein 17-like [Ananas comosus]
MSSGAHDRPLTTFSVRKDSHTISKPKPKIRIVHIFAPEIIKTDVDNFRELVQQLTGKPGKKTRGRIIKKTVNRSPTEMSGLQRNNLHGREKADIKGEAREEDGRRPWPDGSPSGGGYLSGLEDDHDHGFFQGLAEFTWLLPLGSSGVDV